MANTDVNSVMIGRMAALESGQSGRMKAADASTKLLDFGIFSIPKDLGIINLTSDSDRKIQGAPEQMGNLMEQMAEALRKLNDAIDGCSKPISTEST
jgi:hypothetical protein